MINDKMKICKMIGIIVLAAVMVFSMTGCKEPGPDNITTENPDNQDEPGNNDPQDGTLPELSGKITISPNEDVTVGMELTAAYDGDEDVSFHWNKDGEAIANETLETYTPEEPGSFTVTVSTQGYKSKTSAAVEVTGAPLPDLEGEVTISPDTNVTIYMELTAFYDGDEDISLQWNKDGDAIHGETGDTYTPTVAGSYSVTAHAEGYKHKTSATVEVSAIAPYIITGNGTEGGVSTTFTASRGSTIIKTGTLQEVITEIKTDADGKIVSIQFGNGTDTLNIGNTAGTSIANFNNTGDTWGLILLSGKISSANSYQGNQEATVKIGEGVSIISTADIANTYTGTGGAAIYNRGTVTISDGTISTTANTSYAIYNYNVVTILSGTISTTGTGSAIYNSDTGAATISGGTISTTTGAAVYHNSTGVTIVSGTAFITSKGTNTIELSNTGTGGTRLIILGGTVQNTQDGNRVIYNNSTGAVEISGGTVSATTGTAVTNARAGTITVSGTANVTSANNNTSQGTIQLITSGSTVATRLTISGGTVSNTAAGGNAVYNASTGAIIISGGTVSATTGVAVYSASTGSITVSGTANVTSANNNTSQGTIFVTGVMATRILGGTVSNTDADGNAVRNNSTGAITLGGNPTITGPIFRNTATTLNLTGTPTFDPQSDRVYTLDYAEGIYAANVTAVTGGTNFFDNFTLANTNWKLITSGNNLVLAENL